MNATIFMETVHISDEIEQLRTNMNRLGDQYGLRHPDVMRCSRQLDELLIIYQRLTREK